MERLTERANDEFDGIYVKDHDYIAASHKLADYEDAEESGLLVRLPCEINQKLYFIFDLCLNYKFSGWTKEQREKYNGKIVSDEVATISFMIFAGKKIILMRTRRFNLSFNTDNIGKTVFFTHEEAEQVLKGKDEKINVFVEF